MAIEIIKHGNKLSETCPDCGCEFTFLPEDMDEYWRGGDYFESITCPDCRKKIVWDFGKKSRRIKHGAEIKYQILFKVIIQLLLKKRFYASFYLTLIIKYGII